MKHYLPSLDTRRNGTLLKDNYITMYITISITDIGHCVFRKFLKIAEENKEK